MTISTDKNKIQELLTRGVENIYPSKEFLEKKLLAGEKLSLYLGIDPTGPFLHLGHAIPLLKLKQFQELGHEVILLIGDFTGMIGDPTDKSAVRKKLTREQVLDNCKNYKKQAGKILDMKKVDLKFNSKWLGKLIFQDVLELASEFTVQQILARDMFEKRMKEGKPIHLHEFLYPLMQGYDSVAMDVDGEVGGNDQTFNMLAGRTLMKSLKNKEKFVLTTKLLVDATGKKMGKTEGNMVTLEDSADEMFGKVMSWSDEMIISGFELITLMPMAQIKDFEKQLGTGKNPRDLKILLAKEVVKTFIGKKEARVAEENFIQVFQKKEKPDDMPEVEAAGEKIIGALVKAKLVSSKSDVRRLIEQKGIKVNDQVVENIDLELKSGDIVQKGKRFFVRIK
jgi:tyrosyl-tRNA synthetase